MIIVWKVEYFVCIFYCYELIIKMGGDVNIGVSFGEIDYVISEMFVLFYVGGCLWVNYEDGYMYIGMV